MVTNAHGKARQLLSWSGPAGPDRTFDLDSSLIVLSHCLHTANQGEVCPTARPAGSGLGAREPGSSAGSRPLASGLTPPTSMPLLFEEFLPQLQSDTKTDYFDAVFWAVLQDSFCSAGMNLRTHPSNLGLAAPEPRSDARRYLKQPPEPFNTHNRPTEATTTAASAWTRTRGAGSEVGGRP